MTSRVRLAVAALSGLIAIILGFAVYHKIRQSSLETAREQSAETPGGADSALNINPAALPHVPDLLAQPKLYTNEALQDFLEQDKKRLGIKKIYTQDELKALKSSASPAKTQQREADRAKMRAMANEIQAAVEVRKKVPVVLSGDKTKLLSSPADSYSATGSPLSDDKSGRPPVDDQK